jgi:hypothetical protein
MFSYVWCVVWEYFVCVHPHHTVVVFGLYPFAFVRCEYFGGS